MTRPTKILLTGATGFLGSYLLKAFLKNGFKIAILKRSFSDTWRIKDCLDNVKSFDIDLVALEKPFEECGSFDCVVHTAANYGKQGELATEVLGANLEYPLRLIQTAVSFNSTAFYYAGTTLNQDLNYYALSKRQFEDWGRVFANQGKIRFINIKLQHLYGFGDDPSKFTTHVVRSCLRNVPELALTRGDQKRDFIHIDDAVDAYLELLDHCIAGGNAYQEFELGSGNAVSIKEYVERIRLLTKSSTKLDFGRVPYRDHEIMNSQADTSKLLHFGWKAKHDLTSGLQEMINSEREYLGIGRISCVT